MTVAMMDLLVLVAVKATVTVSPKLSAEPMRSGPDGSFYVVDDSKHITRIVP